MSSETDFIKNLCQLSITGKNGDISQTKFLKKAILFGSSKKQINKDNVI